MNRSEQMIILFYQGVMDSAKWLHSKVNEGLQHVLPEPPANPGHQRLGSAVKVKVLSGALCTGPVAPGFAEMHSSPVDVVLKHFLLSVPFFISSILTYATIIFLRNKAHWNFSSLPSLNNQQVVCSTNIQPQPSGRVRRLLLPVTCGASLFPFYGQL